VLAQSVGRLEVLVVDDGSEDDPSGVVRDLADARVRVWRQENRGLAGARNAGFVRTAAPVVCFLDADDMVAPSFAERMLARLAGADAAACAYKMMGERGEDLRWLVRPADHDLTVERLIEGNPLGVGGVLLRRAAAERFVTARGLFDESLRVVEDWDLWLRMTAGGAEWAPVEREPLFLCRLRAGSLSRGVERMWRTGLVVLHRAGAAEKQLRRWHLRALAHAVATEQRGLLGELRREIGRVRDEDSGVLAGALREAFCRENRVGPGDAWRHETAWRSQIERLLPGCVIAGRIGWERDRWDRVARGAAAGISKGDTLVVYGAGENGRAVLEALDAMGVRAVVIDDHPAAGAGRAKIALEQVTGSHVVLVTPEERGPILARLAAAGVKRVLVPEDLLQARASA
jgi:hypothetical protein